MAENISGIIDAIAEKAAADADKIVALAEEYAAAKLAAATEEAERYLSESAADTAARCAFIRERSESNARIDRKKALAGAKADVVDEVFNAVRQKLENMPVKEAAQLFIALIEKYADDGDTAVLSSRYAVEKGDIAASHAAVKKGVSVQTDDKLSPGMLISGKTADKDFTFASIAAYYKEVMSADVARQLFDKH